LKTTQNPGKDDVVENEPTTTMIDVAVTATAATNTATQTANNRNNVNGPPRQQVGRPATSTARAPATLANYTGHSFIPIAPLIPMHWQIPFIHNSPQLAPCCKKHAEWLRTRIGRPPHHPLCYNRN